MILTILLDILGGIAGLWIASHYIQGVQFAGSLKVLLTAGTILGVVLAFLRPILNLITFIIRLIILVTVSVALVWLLGLFYPELSIHGFIPLVWTAIAISAISVVVSVFAHIRRR